MIPKDKFIHHLHAERSHHPAELAGIADTAEEEHAFSVNTGERHRFRCTYQCFGRESRDDGIDRGNPEPPGSEPRRQQSWIRLRPESEQYPRLFRLRQAVPEVFPWEAALVFRQDRKCQPTAGSRHGPGPNVGTRHPERNSQVNGYLAQYPTTQFIAIGANGHDDTRASHCP